MIRYFATHPTAANLTMVAFIALGLIFAGTIKRSTFPDLPADEVEIRTLYPGATAEDVEETVCQRIEDAIEAVNDVAEVRCEARENIGTAIVKMVEGKNFDRFFNDIKTQIDTIDNFPAAVEAPVIKQIGLTNFVAALAVTGPMAAADLKAYAEDLKTRLLALDKISQISISGFSDNHQIRIEVPAHALRQHGLSISGIADAIARQSVDLPAGIIETRNIDVLIRFDDERRKPLDFEDLIIIAGQSGAELRLGDIAKISDRFGLDEDKVIFNGRRAAILSLTRSKADDTLTIMDTLRAFLDRERKVAPPGIEFEITSDISSIVRDRLNLLIKNGFQGLLLVVLTLWLFFSVRFSFWVAMGFPVSFLGTIFVMAMAGFSFDMITMVALLIAVGLLVDDAIVISENIATHVRRGATPLEAAVTGTREVLPGIISSFLTTIFVFGSLAFLKGDLGAILKIMPVIVIITLSVSLVEAFFILPHHISGSLRRSEGKAPSALRRRLEDGFNWVRDRVVIPVVTLAVAWRYFTVGAILALLLVSVSMIAGGVLKFRAFPEIEGNVIEVRILLPQGTPLARTEKIAARVTSAIKQINAELTPLQPGGQALVRNISVQFSKNIDAFETGPHLATVTADLLSTEIRTATVDDILNRWRELVGSPADVIALKYLEPNLGPAGRPIDFRLKGNDLGRLKAASTELQAWLNAYAGVTDLTDDLRPGKPEFRLKLLDGAAVLGLDAQMIASQLRAALFGRTASEIQVGSEAYEIDVRLAAIDRDSFSDLEDFTVTAPGGELVPLSTVASLEPGRGFARINRIDRLRTVSIQGEVDTSKSNTAEIMADTTARFLPGLAARFPDVQVSLEGEVRQARETGGSIRNGFLIGLVGVFFVLSFQFRNYVEPVIVMLAIPMGLIGLVWGHLALGLDLSMPSMVGFASLAGIVVNNSILMVAFIKIERRAGLGVAEAAIEAARNRFRAILLTSATTIMGLLPLMSERSLQAQVLIPLVAAIAFGLLVSTILIPVMVPALYVILDDFGLAAKIETKAETAGTGSDEAPAPA